MEQREGVYHLVDNLVSFTTQASSLQQNLLVERWSRSATYAK